MSLIQCTYVHIQCWCLLGSKSFHYHDGDELSGGCLLATAFRQLYSYNACHRQRILSLSWDPTCLCCGQNSLVVQDISKSTGHRAKWRSFVCEIELAASFLQRVVSLVSELSPVPTVYFSIVLEEGGSHIRWCSGATPVYVLGVHCQW